jgi:hypothetical protein
MATRIQQDASGEFVEVTEGSGVNFDAQPKTPAAQGAQINPNQKYNGRVRQGEPDAVAAAVELHGQLLAEYDQLDEQITALEDAGRDVPKQMRERRTTLRHDVAMQYARAGGDISELLK